MKLTSRMCLLGSIVWCRRRARWMWVISSILALADRTRSMNVYSVILLSSGSGQSRWRREEGDELDEIFLFLQQESTHQHSTDTLLRCSNNKKWKIHSYRNLLKQERVCVCVLNRNWGRGEWIGLWRSMSCWLQLDSSMCLSEKRFYSIVFHWRFELFSSRVLDIGRTVVLHNFFRER